MTLKYIIKKEIKSEFAKNFLTLFTGVSISQIIPIFVAPILTRLYSPEEFGILALFVTTGSFFGNIATFHYDSAIMLPAEEKDAVNVLALSLILTLFMTLFSLILVVFFNSQLVTLMNNEKIGTWLYLVPISVLLSGVFRSFSVWATRHKQFKLIAMRNITQTASTNGIKVTFGFFKFNNIGLIFGTLLGQIIATSLLVFESIKKTSLNIKQISKKGIIFNAKRYKEFPLFTNWQGFFDVFNETGSRYIISNVFGSTILGWYSFTIGLLQKPLHIIGQSVSNVYYQRCSDLNNSGGDLWGFTKKIIVRLSIVGLIIFVPLLFFAPFLFNFIFGENWATAGKYAQLITPWLFMKFILSPITSIPIIKKSQKKFFIISLFYNITFPAMIIILSIFVDDFNIILLVCSLFMFLVFGIIILWFRSLLKRRVL